MSGLRSVTLGTNDLSKTKNYLTTLLVYNIQLKMNMP